MWDPGLHLEKKKCTNGKTNGNHNKIYSLINNIASILISYFDNCIILM